MTAIRAVLIATIILGLAATPLVAQVFGGSSLDDSTAYAAFAGSGRQDGDSMAVALANNNRNDNNNNNSNGNSNNNNGDDNDNNNNDNSNNNNSDDNGNGNGNGNGNKNGNGNGNGNKNGNGNDNVRVVIRRPNESVNRPTKCFDTRELGVVQLGTGGYDVTVEVMPHSSFGQTTRLTLHSVNPTTGQGRPSEPPIALPALTGSLVGGVMFDLDAQSSCDGAALGTLPNTVNLGIIYNVTNTVDKSKLQIVRLQGGAWVNVDTVPDPTPGNPYVSASVNTAGTYALIQRP